jgi:DNA repair protein RecO (recombination protein O)
LGTLSEWVQRDPFSGLRRDLLRQYGGLYAAEAVAKLTEEHDPHAELFAALRTLLGDLAGGGGEPSGDPVAAIVRFQGALLRAIGYAPVLRRCVDCGRPRVRGTPGYFSSTAGGLVCRDCEAQHIEKRRVSPIMLDGPPEQQRAAEWFALLDYHLTHVAGQELHTAGELRVLVAAAG